MLQMDSLIFPRSVILEKALHSLTFNQPNYLYEPWDDGLFRCKIKFSSSALVTDQMPDDTYKIWSGWFPSAEEAKENAAHRALALLETISLSYPRLHSICNTKIKTTESSPFKTMPRYCKSYRTVILCLVSNDFRYKQDKFSVLCMHC